MKITLAQQNYIIGDFQGNTDAILNAINQSRQNSVELIVFPELAISGYPPKDLLHFDAFIEKCNEALLHIVSACKDISCIIGVPVFNTRGIGKRLHNAAVVIHNQQIKEVVYKTLLPTYDIFDEYRYFEPNESFKLVNIAGKHIALTICEDIWYTDQWKLYDIQPMQRLTALSPDLAINIAASPFSYLQHQQRHQVLKYNASTFNIPFIYVNQVGAQTDLIFDGGSSVYDAKGNCVFQADVFKEALVTINIAELNSFHEFMGHSKEASCYQALVFGIREYFQKLGLRKAVIGLSGGIDSALVAVLATQALGAENILCVLMPSQFSSEHSVTDAKLLAENLGVESMIVEIEPVYEGLLKALEPKFKGTPFGLAEENLQSRIRGNILMGLSNKLGYILLNTSNKSELAVGYGTMYGDMAGGLSVIGDVYKTDVFAMCTYINTILDNIIPEHIITKAPSAELRPDQKDSDSLPDYNILDKILYLYIEENKGKAEIIQQGWDSEIVEKTLKLVNMSEFKRHQAPPILRVSPRAFGSGRRMPIVGKY